MHDREEAIKLKLAKANSLLREVDILIEHELFSTALNRLYYSCFHATKALLLTKDLIPKTHSGVVSSLHLYFVQPGLFSLEHATYFSKLMQERIEDDYSDFVVSDSSEIIPLIEPGKHYVKYVVDFVLEFLGNQ